MLVKYDHLKKFKVLNYNKFDDILHTAKSNLKIPCFSEIISAMNICGGWCTITQPNYKFLDEISSLLQSDITSPIDKCIANNFSIADIFSLETTSGDIRTSFFNSKNPIYITWHVRSGDACIHCGVTDIPYYSRLYSHVIDIIHSITTTRHIYLVLFTVNAMTSQDIQAFKTALPNSTVVSGPTHSLEKTLCQFFHSDIHISGGSSLSNLLVFRKHKPLIFDSMRKEFVLWHREVPPSQHHIYSNHSEVLLDEHGVPYISDTEIADRLRNVLKMNRKLF